MFTTNKINLISALFGGRQASPAADVNNLSTAQIDKEKELNDLDRRISITKSEDLYKAHSTYAVNPFSQMNK
ncbi:MAG: hypothetical protein M0P11_00200 [Anaerolineaceae bacterium]|nr:hypothetical protein [Anaerolineaceae bacterium]